MFGGLVDAPTIHSAWRTHAALYPSAAMDAGEFLRRVLAGAYELKSPAAVSRSLLNFDPVRLRGETAAAMFPPGDRPRGDDHLVVSALSRAKCLSPVLIAVEGARHVLLDGVHRILAAKLAGNDVRACYVRVPCRALGSRGCPARSEALGPKPPRAKGGRARPLARAGPRAER